MKKTILTILCFTLCIPILRAQWSPEKEYFIQTREGLCLSNQNTNDELALVRFMSPDAGNAGQKWQIIPCKDGFKLRNVSSQHNIDNVGTHILNLFQMQPNDTASSQLWQFVPVPGKDGYYTVASHNFANCNWSTNYNGAVSLATPNIYLTAQWIRISETLLPPDNETQPDKEPVITTGTQQVEFSTETTPVWYKMNPFYANSPTINKTNLVAYRPANADNYIIKSAANTHISNVDFSDPDAALWRLEGNSDKFYLINKGTNLRLTYPQGSDKHYTLSTEGNTFRIRKSAELDKKMQPDAYYLEPTDPTMLTNGRVHCEGATGELIIFKNGNADVVGGKGSTYIFIETPVKQIYAKANNEAWGTVHIRKDKVPAKFADGSFIFEVPDEEELASPVFRSINNKVTLVAVPATDCKFVEWRNDSGNVIANEATWEYTKEVDLVAEAIFARPTSINSTPSKDDYAPQLNPEGNCISVSAEGGTLTIYSSTCKKIQLTTEKKLHIGHLEHGIYIIKADFGNITRTSVIVK